MRNLQPIQPVSPLMMRLPGWDLTFGGSGKDASGDLWTYRDGYLDTEDINRNDLLDTGDPDHTALFSFTSSSADYPTTDWSYLRIPLSAADREKLTGVNGVRIYLVNTGSSEVETVLLSGDLFFEGSPMLTSAPEDSDGFQPGASWEGQLPQLNFRPGPWKQPIPR